MDASSLRKRLASGFTLVEVMIIAALIGATAAMTVPAMRNFFTDLRLKSAARDGADAFRLARAEAIRTGTPHIVFFSTGGGTDPGGNPLPTDPTTGAPVPLVILRDDNGNCRIEGAEPQTSIYAKSGLSWGTTVSGTAIAPSDNGGPDHSSGSSFRTAGGLGVHWVQFGSDGIPGVFDAACALGGLGTGSGALYLTNGRRDYAVVLSPLGATRVHNWNAGAGAWSR